MLGQSHQDIFSKNFFPITVKFKVACICTKKKQLNTYHPIHAYGVAGNFHLCIFLHNFKFSTWIKFGISNFRIFQVLQATPPGKHVALIRTFWIMLHTSFTIKAMIPGYRIYRDIWSAAINEKLPCEKESGNPEKKFHWF